MSLNRARTRWTHFLSAAAACALIQTTWADYTVPVLQLPELRRISDGSVVDPSSIRPSVSGTTAIGIPIVRLHHPEITGAGQAVVVIDTGIDYTHPSIASNYLAGYDFTTGLADPMDNWAGGEGHGTHVSGIIVSTSAAYPGVAPGAKVIALKVFNSTTGLASDAHILAALNWVETHQQQYNITTVNISLGDGTESTRSSFPGNDPYQAALKSLKDKGIFVAAASGNDSYLHGQSMPAASQYVVSVGATYTSNDWQQYMVSSPGSVDPYMWQDANGQMQHAFTFDNGPRKDDIAFFTNRYKTADDGATSLMAPGIFVTSTIPLTLDNDGTADGFTDMAGTSMASPQVAGASMLVRQALEQKGLLDSDPTKQVDQILAILQDTGTDLYDNFMWFGGNNSTVMEVPPGSEHYVIGRGTYETYSRIDVGAAVDFILGPGVPEPGTLGILTVGVSLLLLRRKR